MTARVIQFPIAARVIPLRPPSHAADGRRRDPARRWDQLPEPAFWQLVYTAVSGDNPRAPERHLRSVPTPPTS